MVCAWLCRCVCVCFVCVHVSEQSFAASLCLTQFYLVSQRESKRLVCTFSFWSRVASAFYAHLACPTPRTLHVPAAGESAPGPESLFQERLLGYLDTEGKFSVARCTQVCLVPFFSN